MVKKVIRHSQKSLPYNKIVSSEDKFYSSAHRFLSSDHFCNAFMVADGKIEVAREKIMIADVKFMAAKEKIMIANSDFLLFESKFTIRCSKIEPSYL